MALLRNLTEVGDRVNAAKMVGTSCRTPTRVVDTGRLIGRMADALESNHFSVFVLWQVSRMSVLPNWKLTAGPVRNYTSTRRRI